MADLSKIVLPNNTRYDLKDETARNNTLWYGVCSTSVTSSNKEVTIENLPALTEGLQIRVRFTTLSGTEDLIEGPLTLNVNNLGAKEIWLNTGAAPVGIWKANQEIDFFYHNNHWVIADASLATTDYYGRTILSDSISNSSDKALTPAGAKAQFDLIDTAASYAIGDSYIPVSVSGQIINITDGADSVPVKKMQVEIEPSQSGSGTVSPTNPRLFAGTSNITISKNGTQVVGSLLSYNQSASGMTTSTLTVPAEVLRNGQLYRCLITDSNLNTCYTNSVALFVENPSIDLKILSHPGDIQTVKNTTVVFSVIASGEDLTYQWEYQAPDTTLWKTSTMTGYNTNAMSVGATTARNGYRYRCVVTDGSRNTAISNAGTLIIVETAPAITITSQPSGYISNINNSGENITFTVEATGDDLTYQWEYQDPTAEIWKTDWNTNALTIYGGNLNVTSGLLTVTHKVIDLTEKHFEVMTGAIFRIAIPDLQQEGHYTDFLCSHFIRKADADIANNPSAGEISNNYSTTLNVRMCLENATTATFRQWLMDQSDAGTPVQLYHYLAKPITYQLTASEIITALGSNTFTTNGETMALTYYIEQSDPISDLSKMLKDLLNDFSAAQEKLAGIEAGAEKNPDLSGYALKPGEVTLTGTEITLNAVANTRYTAGELTSLNLTPPASGMIDIVFFSGDTATTLTLPASVTMPDGFEVEANMRYEINILDGYGVAQSWPYEGASE